LPPWYRLLGAKLARGAEVSTASFISPDLLSIGEDSFIADAVSLGRGARARWLRGHRRNHIGKRSFIGNSAVLPPAPLIGDRLPHRLSLRPAGPIRRTAHARGHDVDGLAAIFRRNASKARRSARNKPQPSRKLRGQRALIEFVRVICRQAASSC